MRETRSQWRTRFEALIRGLEKQAVNDPRVRLGRVGTSAKDAALALRRALDAATRSDHAYAAWRDAVREEKENLAVAHPLSRLVAAFALGAYGFDRAAADYGVHPRRVGFKSSEVKARAAERARATRAARHTKGKRRGR